MSAEFPSISVLIPELKQGDTNAWNELVKMFLPGLSAKAKQVIRGSKLQRRLDPEELANMALIKAWDRHQSLAAQTTRQVASFLLTTMNRIFIDKYRPQNLEASSPTWFAPAAENQTPSQVAISNETEERLHAALAEVSDRQREVLIMRHFEGLKFREIAGRLDVSMGVVANAAREGLKVLTARMLETSKHQN